LCLIGMLCGCCTPGRPLRTLSSDKLLEVLRGCDMGAMMVLCECYMGVLWVLYAWLALRDIVLRQAAGGAMWVLHAWPAPKDIVVRQGAGGAMCLMTEWWIKCLIYG
jgi:hypothetical protein